MEVKIKCDTKDMIALDLLIPFQGDLKKLSEENYEKLKQQIVDEGFIAPFLVWENEAQLYLLDGHQRFTTLNRMRDEQIFTLPEFWPIVKVQADSFKQAKKRILALSSQYGTMTMDGLTEFISDSDIDFDVVKDEFFFDAIDFSSMNNSLDDIENNSDEIDVVFKYKIEVDCLSEECQSLLVKEFEDRKFKVRVLL